MKLYTKTGDEGQTSLYGGERRSKANSRVAAYGDVDELQAVLGVTLGICDDGELADIIGRVQVQGFVLCSQLARPDGRPVTSNEPSISEEEIVWLEGNIDRLDAELPTLRSFILQGGVSLASHLHLARTVCRRAERSVVSLSADEPVDPLCLKYLNRLSDLLFVMARTANHRQGMPDTPWKWHR
jgi:cob(I)alamin adenosyltransferase